jgi:oligoendopeptidase F
LSDKVRNGTKEDRDNYLKFLSGGSSLYPIGKIRFFIKKKDMLKVAGVDMSKTDAIEKAIMVFKGLIDEFEKLIEN